MNWGIIGYGEIAPSFIQGLSVVEGQRVYAIATKSKHEILNSENTYPDTQIFSSYKELLSNQNIEIVYICTTNNLHKENVLSSLRAGKHVLCEKPMGVCKKDVTEYGNGSRKTKQVSDGGNVDKVLACISSF